MAKPPRILVIAGSDSSGGAGIQADIKTITMLSGYAMTAITAVTAQNSIGVQAVQPMPAELVHKQIRSCIEDIGVDAIKIGMLHNKGIIEAVSDALMDTDPDIVFDPVMVATSGDPLIAPEAIQAIKDKIYGCSTVVTPNLPELGMLLGREVTGADQMLAAASELGQRAFADILAKGGHADGDAVIDMLVDYNGKLIAQFEHERIDTQHTHGTGCTLSSAIATLLGHGLMIKDAARIGRKFVLEAIKNAPGYGQGHGPLGHQAVRKV
jgi:hydroxymethylpyrimidine/phosphomethylpyrimidine kinase